MVIIKAIAALLLSSMLLMLTLLLFLQSLMLLMLELSAGNTFPKLDLPVTCPRRLVTLGSWMIGLLLVVASASLAGCSFETSSA